MRVSKQTAFEPYLKRVAIFSLMLFLASCRSSYIPTTQIVPLFEEKNELQIYGGAAFGERSAGGDVQAAYSITNHIAVAASGYLGSTEDVGFNKGELALGYFTELGHSGPIFEVYGGLGSGGLQYSSKELKQENHFKQYFIQPNIGIHLGQVDLAFSTRVNYAVWDKKDIIYFEPAFTLRSGGEKALFQFQIATSFESGSNYRSYDLLDNYESNERFHMSFGIFVPIQLSKNK